jgi:hypothetical protein
MKISRVGSARSAAWSRSQVYRAHAGWPGGCGHVGEPVEQCGDCGVSVVDGGAFVVGERKPRVPRRQMGWTRSCHRHRGSLGERPPTVARRHRRTRGPRRRSVGLLYAQWPAAISRLTLAHVQTSAWTVRLRLAANRSCCPNHPPGSSSNWPPEEGGHAALVTKAPHPGCSLAGDPDTRSAAPRMSDSFFEQCQHRMACAPLRLLHPERLQQGLAARGQRQPAAHARQHHRQLLFLGPTDKIADLAAVAGIVAGQKGVQVALPSRRNREVAGGAPVEQI